VTQVAASGGALSQTLDEVIERRMALLTDYQDAAYAARYRALVERVRSADSALGRSALCEAVARYYAKLLAYKDEYEVARLHTDGRFMAEIGRRFEGRPKVRLHLAPPLLAQRDPVTGHLKKKAYGPWIFTAMRYLARMKRLRGSRLDPFGHSEERRTERRLIGDYEAVIDELLAGLSPDNYGLAVEIAQIPEQIRGYGHVKQRHLEAARRREAELLAAFRAPDTGLTAAA
jgi:indolepyruvate ferredoxin oxidoreductase